MQHLSDMNNDLSDVERNIQAVTSAPAKLLSEPTPMVSLDPPAKSAPATSLVTVTIGRNVDNVQMSPGRWRLFQRQIHDFLRIMPGGDQGMAEVFGPFIGVGHWNGYVEESVTYTSLTTHPSLDSAAPVIGELLGDVASRFCQDAIAWSYGPALLARP